MKKCILTALLIVCSAATLWAQQYAEGGFKAGMNYSGLSSYQQQIYQAYPELPSGLNFNSKPCFRLQAGSYVRIPLSEPWSFQPEILLSWQGYRFSAPHMNNTVKLFIKQFYINLPLLMQYRIVESITLQAGPQLGYLAKGELNAEYGEVKEKRKAAFSAFDLSLAIGASYQPVQWPLGFYLRYTTGLNNINNDSEREYTLRNQVAQAGIFYRLTRFKKSSD